MAFVVSEDFGMTVRAWWQNRALDPDTSGHTEDPAAAARSLRSLVDDGLLDLPYPGSGHTRERYDALASLGELDLTIARLAEAHVDALAIVAELGSPHVVEPGSVWGVWAAEPPSARVAAVEDEVGRWTLSGRKAWCSGAGSASHAVVTAHADNGPRLFAVDLADSGVVPVDDPWPTAALAGTDTRSVDFVDAPAIALGDPNAYVNRAGFWHGSVGVAAVWYGGTVGVARTMLQSVQSRRASDLDHAQLGGIGAALTAARSALAIAADSFDDDPMDSSGRAMVIALGTRAVVEAAATEVIDRVGRGLGAAPLALDGRHARRVADLQLYLRQSHGDRDLAALGKQMIAVGDLW